MGRHYYAALCYRTSPGMLALVQRFDDRLRRDEWVSGAVEAGLEIIPTDSAQAKTLAVGMVNRLDGFFQHGTTHKSLPHAQDEYYRRNPFCDHHEGNDMPPFKVADSLKPYLYWSEINRGELEVWHWWEQLPEEADRTLAGKLERHLSELKRQSLDREVECMYSQVDWLTDTEAKLLSEESNRQGWWPCHTVGSMSEYTRKQIRKAVEADTAKDFVDTTYKLGLFLEP